MRKFRTHYDNLKIAETAGTEDIIKAYLLLSRQWDPDKHPRDREETTRILRIIDDAYTVLSDPAKRKKHDTWISDQRVKAEKEANRTLKPNKKQVRKLVNQKTAGLDEITRDEAMRNLKRARRKVHVRNEISPGKQHLGAGIYTVSREEALDNVRRVLGDDLKSKITRNLTSIESRDDLSADQKASRVIQIFSATCAGAATQPLPFADIFVLTPIQAYMAERLAAVRGVPMKEGSGKELVTDLGKVIGLGMLAQQAALGLYKVGLPFLAGFTTIPLVYGLTYGIGNVLDYLFVERAKGNKLSPEQIKSAWAKARKEGMAKGKEYVKSRKSDGE